MPSVKVDLLFVHGSMEGWTIADHLHNVCDLSIFFYHNHFIFTVIVRKNPTSSISCTRLYGVGLTLLYGETICREVGLSPALSLSRLTPTPIILERCIQSAVTTLWGIPLAGSRISLPILHRSSSFRSYAFFSHSLVILYHTLSALSSLYYIAFIRRSGKESNLTQLMGTYLAPPF